MFLRAAAARLITSNVDITVVAIPAIGVSTSPDLNVSVGPPRHGTPRFALMRSITSPAVNSARCERASGCTHDQRGNCGDFPPRQHPSVLVRCHGLSFAQLALSTRPQCKTVRVTLRE